MKQVLLALTLLTTGIGSAIADDRPRQLYAPIQKIYTLEESRNLSLYKWLLEKGTPESELNQEGAFVETYADTKVSIWGRSKVFANTVYLPPALRHGIELDTIVVANRYERHQIGNEVVPRSNSAAYDCIPHPTFFRGIALCIEDVINAQAEAAKKETANAEVDSDRKLDPQ